MSVLYLVFLYLFSLLVFGLFVYNWRLFYLYFKKSPRKIFFLSIALFCLAFSIRQFLVPHLHHVFYDEFNYINVAQNMYYSNIVGATASGDKLNPEIVEGTFRPGGYSFLLNIVFRILGDSDNSVYLVNVFLGALSVVLIFWIALLLFDNNISIGLWSAIIFNFLPSHLKYSGCGSCDTSSLFFILLSLWILLLYLKTKSNALVYIASFSSIFSAYIRPENIIFYFFILILIFREYKKGYISKDGILSIVQKTFIFILPLIIKIPHMIGIEQDNAARTFWSMSNFFNNFSPNLHYLFDFRYHSIVGTFFMLAGIIFLFFKDKKKFLFLTGWFLLFYFISTSYFMGKWSLMYTTDSDRHFFPIAVSFCILGGYGIHSFITKVYSKRNISRIILFICIGSLIILNSFIATYNIIKYTFSRPVYKALIFLKENANTLPAELFILNYEPIHIISALDRKAIKFSTFFTVGNFPSKIILFKGFWWAELKDSSTYYESLLSKIYNFNVIKEKKFNGNTKYGFYLLSKKDKLE